MSIYFKTDSGSYGPINPKIIKKSDLPDEVSNFYLPFHNIGWMVPIINSFLDNNNIDLILITLSEKEWIDMFNLASFISFRDLKKKLEDVLAKNLTIESINSLIMNPDDIDSLVKKWEKEQEKIKEQIRIENEKALEEQERIKLLNNPVKVWFKEECCGELNKNIKNYLGQIIDLKLKFPVGKYFVLICNCWLQNSLLSEFPLTELIETLNNIHLLDPPIPLLLKPFKDKLIDIISIKSVSPQKDLFWQEEDFDEIKKLQQIYISPKQITDPDHLNLYINSLSSLKFLDQDLWEILEQKIILEKIPVKPSDHFINQIIKEDRDRLFCWLIQENLLTDYHKDKISKNIINFNAYKIHLVNIYLFDTFIKPINPNMIDSCFKKSIKYFISRYPKIREGLFNYVVRSHFNTKKTKKYVKILNEVKPLTNEEFYELLFYNHLGPNIICFIMNKQFIGKSECLLMLLDSNIYIHQKNFLEKIKKYLLNLSFLKKRLQLFSLC